MSTPHLMAAPGDFADIVLMPGDPLRARMMAERWLEDAREVNSVRAMYGYTGHYRGRRISVLPHGMGIPSTCIYATELIRHYGVRTLIRVGSCGALAARMQLGDIVLAMGASTDSKVNRMRFMDHDFAALADYPLLAHCARTAEQRAQAIAVGNVFSADLFYTEQPELFDHMERMQILAVEMELAGLYGVAAQHGAAALGILTVSDHIRRGEHMSPQDRQNSLIDMLELAFETAASWPVAA